MAAADARFFGDKFLVMECTLVAETSVSNLTLYKLFIGDDKKIRFLERPSPLMIRFGANINQCLKFQFKCRYSPLQKREGTGASFLY